MPYMKANPLPSVASISGAPAVLNVRKTHLHRPVRLTAWVMAGMALSTEKCDGFVQHSQPPVDKRCTVCLWEPSEVQRYRLPQGKIGIKL